MIIIIIIIVIILIIIITLSNPPEGFFNYRLITMITFTMCNVQAKFQVNN